MKIIHPDNPDAPPSEVSERAFAEVWQERGFVEVEVDAVGRVVTARTGAASKVPSPDDNPEQDGDLSTDPDAASAVLD